ncbi:unnamed protein product [Cyclocybe aegerita]|uniref:Uncharacterized protein n=1 Tax=Cyclocybe aegerita TaxID=1973307 RepID=A0A8S0VV99_CYCAE|nr:unnamed protein product [Cyclocybe aegerita]
MSNRAWSNPPAIPRTYPSQQFFYNARGAQLIDTIIEARDDAPPSSGRPGGRINVGSGSTNLKFENSVFQTYTGSGEGIDLNAFLMETPILPRARSTHLELSNKTPALVSNSFLQRIFKAVVHPGGYGLLRNEA